MGESGPSWVTPREPPTITALTLRHGEPIPIVDQESEDMGVHLVPLQDSQGATQVQRTICLVDIKKYIITDLLPQDYTLMENFVLQGELPCPSN